MSKELRRWKVLADQNAREIRPSSRACAESMLQLPLYRTPASLIPPIPVVYQPRASTPLRRGTSFQQLRSWVATEMSPVVPLRSVPTRGGAAARSGDCDAGGGGRPWSLQRLWSRAAHFEPGVIVGNRAKANHTAFEPSGEPRLPTGEVKPSSAASRNLSGPRGRWAVKLEVC
jgi:hypothetical protein